MDHEDWTAAGALGDRYLLRARVDSGRTATVYAADDIRLQRRVAVKLFHGLPDEDGLTRFAAEARTLAGLSHPGLVTVYDVCLDSDRPYLVMRLVVGAPLAHRLRHGGLAPSEVARLGAELAEVLAYVHERGVVHGDLDSTNVLVDPQGGGYLSGFGIDRGLGKPSGDVYQLGMTLAECLPFDLGVEWRAVLSAMTARDPDARPDATRSAELLRNVAAGETAAFGLPVLTPYPADPPTVRAEPATKRVRPAYAGVAGLGFTASVLAIVVAAMTGGSPGQSSGERPGTPVEQQPATVAPAAPAATPTKKQQRRQQRQQPVAAARPQPAATHPRPAPPPRTYDASVPGPAGPAGTSNGRGPAAEHGPKDPKRDKG